MSARILVFMIGVFLYGTTQNAYSTEVLTPTDGVSISNGKVTISIKPLIVTQEFAGQKISSPSGVIVVFPYELIAEEGVKTNLPMQIGASFVGRDGSDLRLPSQSFYDPSIGDYFLTFGSHAILNSGISVVPVDVWGGPPFPSIKINLGTTNKRPIKSNNLDQVRKIQELLNKAGYDAGPADGIAGSRTRTAIRAFQKDSGYPESGNVSKELITQLKEQISKN